MFAHPVRSVPAARKIESGECETVRPGIKRTRGEQRTNNVNDVDASNYQRKNDICYNAREEHGQYAEHGVDRGQVQIRLVVQLYPNQPAGESCPVDTRNNLHHGEATMGVSPHRRFHEWRRRPARTWEIGIFKPTFQVVLPQSKQ